MWWHDDVMIWWYHDVIRWCCDMVVRWHRGWIICWYDVVIWWCVDMMMWWCGDMMIWWHDGVMMGWFHDMMMWSDLEVTWNNSCLGSSAGVMFSIRLTHAVVQFSSETGRCPKADKVTQRTTNRRNHGGQFSLSHCVTPEIFQESGICVSIRAIPHRSARAIELWQPSPSVNRKSPCSACTSIPLTALVFSRDPELQLCLNYVRASGMNTWSTCGWVR